jgi:NitT/TauT family transport system ATP-binding protein
VDKKTLRLVGDWRMKQDNDYLLHLEDVIVRYYNPKGEIFTVLNDIDLKVRGGEFVTIVGPSGSGKSTLLRLILGSEKPTEGAVFFAGKEIDCPDRDRGIVFQKYSLFPHLTVLQNLIFGLEAEEFTLAKRILHPFKLCSKRKLFIEYAREYLERVGLGDDGHKYPQQLSGGMRQRVAIAQSLITKPKILLMDEPFGALDDSTRQDMQLFILEQWEKNKMTVIFVTHDLTEAIYLGSRTLILSQYYKTDKEKDEGAKIVTDMKLPGDYPRPSEFKYSVQVNRVMQKLRVDGLDPDHRQHIKDFDLNCKDSFRTVSQEEWKR